MLFLQLCSRAEAIKSASARLSVVRQWLVSDNREGEKTEITLELVFPGATTEYIPQLRLAVIRL